MYGTNLIVHVPYHNITVVRAYIVCICTALRFLLGALSPPIDYYRAAMQLKPGLKYPSDKVKVRTSIVTCRIYSHFGHTVLQNNVRS